MRAAGPKPCLGSRLLLTQPPLVLTTASVVSPFIQAGNLTDVQKPPSPQRPGTEPWLSRMPFSLCFLPPVLGGQQCHALRPGSLRPTPCSAARTASHTALASPSFGSPSGAKPCAHLCPVRPWALARGAPSPGRSPLLPSPARRLPGLQLSLRPHLLWEDVLDALSGGGAVCVCVPCRMSPRVPRHSSLAHCSTFSVQHRDRHIVKSQGVACDCGSEGASGFVH